MRSITIERFQPKIASVQCSVWLQSIYDSSCSTQACFSLRFHMLEQFSISFRFVWVDRLIKLQELNMGPDVCSMDEKWACTMFVPALSHLTCVSIAIGFTHRLTWHTHVRAPIMRCQPFVAIIVHSDTKATLIQTLCSIEHFRFVNAHEK